MMSVKDETMIHDPNTASEVQMRIFAPLVAPHLIMQFSKCHFASYAQLNSTIVVDTVLFLRLLDLVCSNGSANHLF
jgi:hypothetical protein